MIRSIVIILTGLWAMPALAHVGHLGELAGHDHWVAGAAIGVAAAVTIWGALKGRKTDEAQAEEDQETEEEGEAA